MTRLFSVVKRVALVFAVVLATVWIGRAWESRSMPELRLWHQVEFDNEFRAEAAPDGMSFQDYLALEDRLDNELQRKIVDQIPVADQKQLSRYSASSPINPANLPQNWNRTTELPAVKPVGGILLLHGASDSPYSMRAIAELFHQHDFHVIALRLPGHGTTPSGLKQVNADDWIAATRLGVQWLHAKLPDSAPIYLGGYSTGATLALDYTLDAMTSPDLVLPDRLLLFSPAIGVSALALFASWDVTLSKLPFFEKFAWSSIQPEYDPYKYNSFAKNAGDIVHTLTLSITEKIARMKDEPEWARHPPILTFQSVVDSTVLTGSVVRVLYDRLASPDDELVLFDLNRESETLEFVRRAHTDYLERIRKLDVLPYSLTLVTNENQASRSVRAAIRNANGSWDYQELGLEWPPTVYSLSHVAVPFPPDDPLYGNDEDSAYVKGWLLGKIQPRGERRVLTVPIDQLMRLRYNPFFSYLKQRVLEFCPECKQDDSPMAQSAHD